MDSGDEWERRYGTPGPGLREVTHPHLYAASSRKLSSDSTCRSVLHHPRLPPHPSLCAFFTLHTRHGSPLAAVRAAASPGDYALALNGGFLWAKVYNVSGQFFFLYTASQQSRSLQAACQLPGFPGYVGYNPMAIVANTSTGPGAASYSVYVLGTRNTPQVYSYVQYSTSGCSALQSAVYLNGGGDSGGSFALDPVLAYLYLTLPTATNVVMQWSTATGQQTRLINAYNPPLFAPQGLVVDSTSLVYVADLSRIVVFNSVGEQQKVLWGPNRGFPSTSSYMMLDPTNGDFIVPDPSLRPSGGLRRFSADGQRSSLYVLPMLYHTIQGYNVSSPLFGGQPVVSSTGDVYLLDQNADLNAPTQALLIIPPSAFTPVQVVPAPNAGNARASVSAAAVLTLLVSALCAYL